MFTPPVDQINNASVPVSSKGRLINNKVQRVKALQLRAVPGRFSKPENLTFSYKVIEFTKNEMKVYLNFT
jgi:hypothetical protein